MGSLNGDIVVMRNGRSTSQVSVYNYPEHLNPFYEDDQHRRLRFWKISKKDNEGRRNSFSIGNLKDMWAFKSFRTKKKSSTLGINKTSESPPLLRRNYAVDIGNGNGWNTFDHRLRASNTPSINGDSFQRNATYRSSLQTLPTNSERIGLNRNDGYRSTIQVTRSNPRYQPQQKLQQQQTMGVSQNRRYVYGGSVTPQPLRSTRTDICKGPYEYDCDNTITRRSSQSSLMSSNPFESDDENEDIKSSDMRSVINGSTTTLTSRTPRKKRRAPAPPTPTHGRSNGTLSPPIIRIEPSQDNTQDELRIEENVEISNLTAEIESFVKTKTNDDVEVTQKNEVQTATDTSTTKSLDNKEKVSKVDVESNVPVNVIVPKNTSHTGISADDNDTSPKEKVKVAAKGNSPITTEIVTVITTTKTIPVKGTDVAQVSHEIETKTNENKELKVNGAKPKKQSNHAVANSSVVQHVHQQSTTAAVTDLCIKESNSEELSQKPVPLKRQTKPETEVGSIECIHVHVESPKATLRKECHNGLSSFKTTETVQANDVITTKTPFILTSPPIQRRKHLLAEGAESANKETVKISGPTIINKRVNELNIKENRINDKPEILVKPPILSPKPVTKEGNVKTHGFAEIHKPMKRNNPNGHVRKVSRDGSLSPPIVPQPEAKDNEKKINEVVDSHTNGTNDDFKPTTIFETTDSLKIVETSTSVNRNVTDKQVKNVKENNCESSVTTPLANHNEVQNRNNEFDLLYRPKPASHMEWKRSTLAPLETNIPPEKRKSVKDIIESINRSQRLLNAAANKDFTILQNQHETVKTRPSSTISNNNLNENLKILDETQKEINCLLEETAPSTDVGDLTGAAGCPSPSPSNYNNEHIEPQKLDNNEIFKKCKVKKEVYDYRETSPITSNLDWNPVPKPKRTKPGQE